MGVRLRLSDDEAKIIEDLRNNHTMLQAECASIGIPVENVSSYWHKSKHISINVKANRLSIEDLKAYLISEISNRGIFYPKIEYNKYDDAHLMVINPADVHVGKLGVESETGDPHNTHLIVKRVKDGIDGIIQKSKSFNIDKILLVIGADILHTDNPFSTTTSGTRQDTDIMWFDAFKVAQSLYLDAIERLVQIAPVHVQYDPSNHDYQSGFMLAQVIEAWFKNNENVTFNVTISHRKYFNYYSNLIGTTHGDGAKVDKLPLLMAEEASEYWHLSRHRYFYTEHIHHKQSKDYNSVCVESFRSPSGTDSWHHRNGYTHSPKAIEAFIHHKEWGQVARITNIF